MFPSNLGIADFNPRPPRGGRLFSLAYPYTAAKFQSTPSARRATVSALLSGTETKFQSTPSARRATRIGLHCEISARISIHALREEGDLSVMVLGMGRGISIHALREEGDARARQARCQESDFNPRPPRGGRRVCAVLSQIRRNISIHALREEGDSTKSRLIMSIRHFNPRPPRGGRRVQFFSACPQYNFNPRPPRGGRLLFARGDARIAVFQSTPSARRATNEPFQGILTPKFQSTPSARRATRYLSLPDTDAKISIHALREEGDKIFPCNSPQDEHFNPRPPRGGRRSLLLQKSLRYAISIHALREEGDRSDSSAQ